MWNIAWFHPTRPTALLAFPRRYSAWFCMINRISHHRSSRWLPRIQQTSLSPSKKWVLVFIIILFYLLFIYLLLFLWLLFSILWLVCPVNQIDTKFYSASLKPDAGSFSKFPTDFLLPFFGRGRVRWVVNWRAELILSNPFDRHATAIIAMGLWS